MHKLGLKPGSIVLLHINNHLDNLEWFWAVVFAGYMPALSTPFVNNIEQRLKHIDHLHTILDDPVCFTTKELLPKLRGRTLCEFTQSTNSYQRTATDIKRVPSRYWSRVALP